MPTPAERRSLGAPRTRRNRSPSRDSAQAAGPRTDTGALSPIPLIVTTRTENLMTEERKMPRRHQARGKQNRRRPNPHPCQRGERALSRFFEDDQSFRRRLRSRAVGRRGCWSCSGLSPLVSFNVRKDFGSLGLPAEGCRDLIDLCPACSVAYMNSFNDAFARKRGSVERSPRWTVEDLLTSWVEACRGT
jgi:hypothetical protein